MVESLEPQRQKHEALGPDHHLGTDLQTIFPQIFMEFYWCWDVRPNHSLKNCLLL